MTTENLTPTSVAAMLRVTGGNTAQFMEQVALHIEKLETSIIELQARVDRFEGKQNGTKAE